MKERGKGNSILFTALKAGLANAANYGTPARLPKERAQNWISHMAIPLLHAAPPPPLHTLGTATGQSPPGAQAYGHIRDTCDQYGTDDVLQQRVMLRVHMHMRARKQTPPKDKISENDLCSAIFWIGTRSIYLNISIQNMTEPLVGRLPASVPSAHTPCLRWTGYHMSLQPSDVHTTNGIFFPFLLPSWRGRVHATFLRSA